jgi:hypothetical protein
MRITPIAGESLNQIKRSTSTARFTRDSRTLFPIAVHLNHDRKAEMQEVNDFFEENL